jgi:hypothetical protein
VKLGSKLKSNVGKHVFHQDKPREAEFYVVAYDDQGQNKVKSWVTRKYFKN